MPCWMWNMEWELQPNPIEARFEEVACFERPVSSQHKRHNADILCGLEFSPDGHFLASAGVTKQVWLTMTGCFMLRATVLCLEPPSTLAGASHSQS